MKLISKLIGNWPIYQSTYFNKCSDNNEAIYYYLGVDVIINIY